MKEHLLNYIVCPQCRKTFNLSKPQRKNEEIIAGFLICKKGHRYSISKGIPRLLEKRKLLREQKETLETFKLKWQKIPDYGYQEATRKFHLEWYLQRYGWEDISTLTKFLSSKKFILDAGTGLGRDAKLYAENTKGEVFGIDISESIDIAYKNIGHLSNLHLIQADLTNLPFKKQFFDFIACDQVIHHTPDTQKSFLYLTKCLKLKGQISIYVYKKKTPIREFCDDYMREYTTRLSFEECYKVSEAITKFGKSLSEMNIRIDIPEDIPILGIKAGKQDLQRFFYWHIFKCFWNGNFDFKTNVMTNLDWYHPRYAHRHTPEEVKNWVKKAGLKTINFNVIESGISARAKKCVG